MDSKINEHWEHQNTSKNCKDISGYPGKAKITKHNFLETPKKGKMRNKQWQINFAFETTDAQTETNCNNRWTASER